MRCLIRRYIGATINQVVEVVRRGLEPASRTEHTSAPPAIRIRLTQVRRNKNVIEIPSTRPPGDPDQRLWCLLIINTSIRRADVLCLFPAICNQTDRSFLVFSSFDRSRKAVGREFRVSAERVIIQLTQWWLFLPNYRRQSLLVFLHDDELRCSCHRRKAPLTNVPLSTTADISFFMCRRVTVRFSFKQSKVVQ